MTINIFVLKGDFNGKNCSGAFLFLLGIICGHVRKSVALSMIFFDNILIRLGSKLYRHFVGIPMGSNYASLVTDVLCLFLAEL